MRTVRHAGTVTKPCASALKARRRPVRCAYGRNRSVQGAHCQHGARPRLQPLPAHRAARRLARAAAAELCWRAAQGAAQARRRGVAAASPPSVRSGEERRTRAGPPISPLAPPCRPSWRARGDGEGLKTGKSDNTRVMIAWRSRKNRHNGASGMWRALRGLLLLVRMPRSEATRLLLVRHGRTFMNEHLSQPGKAWGSAGQRCLGRAGGVWSRVVVCAARRAAAGSCAARPRASPPMYLSTRLR